MLHLYLIKLSQLETPAVIDLQKEYSKTLLDLLLLYMIKPPRIRNFLPVETDEKNQWSMSLSTL